MSEATARSVIRILFVEDHLALREGTRPLLEAAADLAIVAEASEALILAQRHAPDVVLLDLRLAGQTSGLDVIRHLHATSPQIRILVFTGLDEPEYAREALKHGVRGYLLKTASIAQLLCAIRQVHAGEIVIEPAILAALESLRLREKKADALTERERGVLRLLSRGTTNAHIAEQFILSPRTVEWPVAQLLRKLDLPSRAALAGYAEGAGRGGQVPSQDVSARWPQR